MNAIIDKKRAEELSLWRPLASVVFLVLGVSMLLAVPSVLSAQQCDPTGAHGKHGVFDCKTCHVAGGVLCFDPSGRAVSTLLPFPYFDAGSQTCSNVACHTVLPGTFSFYNVGGDGEVYLNTVNYGSATGHTTPNWFQTVASCTACHDNPPRYGSDGSNVWHSGYHAGGPSDATNQCQFCHPDASGVNNQGTTITDPSLHANGAVNVEARFTSGCFS